MESPRREGLRYYRPRRRSRAPVEDLTRQIGETRLGIAPRLLLSQNLQNRIALTRLHEFNTEEGSRMVAHLVR